MCIPASNAARIAWHFNIQVRARGAASPLTLNSPPPTDATRTGAEEGVCRGKCSRATNTHTRPGSNAAPDRSQELPVPPTPHSHATEERRHRRDICGQLRRRLRRADGRPTSSPTSQTPACSNIVGQARFAAGRERSAASRAATKKATTPMPTSTWPRNCSRMPLPCARRVGRQWR